MRLVAADNGQAFPVPVHNIKHYKHLLEKRDDQILISIRDLMFWQVFLDLSA